MTDLALITNEVNTQVQNPEVQKALLDTTFKGFEPALMKQAIVEGMIRGFDFKDFLQKNVYAIPYGKNYSLVTSIDYNRKIAMRSGLAGIDEPVYVEDKNGEIISCTVTVKRIVSGHVASFTAKVYFKEYYAGHKNPDGSIKVNQWGQVKPTLWDTKPRTMIAKVAEMHALRKACPEELSQVYVEEEIIKETTTKEAPKLDLEPHKAKIESAKTPEELTRIWVALPILVKQELREMVKIKGEQLKAMKPEAKEAEVVETVQILSEEEESEIK